jgi:hypothetical protein
LLQQHSSGSKGITLTEQQGGLTQFGFAQQHFFLTQHLFGFEGQNLHPSTGGQLAHSSIFLHWHSTRDGVSHISSCHPQGVQDFFLGVSEIQAKPNLPLASLGEPSLQQQWQQQPGLTEPPHNV